MNEPPYCYMHENATVVDYLGCGVRGRIPGAWWTLNHRYNCDYEVHRLCIGEGMDETGVREMLGSVDKTSQRARFKFVRDAPDIVVYMHALRAELHMRMVMPAVLGSTPDVPFLGMARMETGASGNPHWHGVGYGCGNSRMDAVGEKLVSELARAELEADGREGV